MNVETVREYCLNKKGVTESFPFDDVSLVVKVMNKMFALIDLKAKQQGKKDWREGNGRSGKSNRIA